jgi:c-di-AMP phosphodiesterase-like protein
VTVKRLLQNDYESTIVKYSILEKAEQYRNHICIAAMDRPVDRVTAAQAADELLNISGIEASVVLYPTDGGDVYLSARSIGSLNVQLVLERLGGGGNMSAAGAQIHGVTVDEAVERLKAAIDEYLA